LTGNSTVIGLTAAIVVELTEFHKCAITEYSPAVV
jgi:hypothetical protein